MKYIINEQVNGFPPSLEYETMYKNSKKAKSSISYYLDFANLNEYSVHFVAGEKEHLEMGILCNEGDLIYPPSSDLYVDSINTNETSSKMKGEFVITKTGLYTSFIVSCGIENQLKITSIPTVTGIVSYINSNGYLPAHKHSYIPLYATTSLVYIVMIYIWSVLCCKNSRNMFFYHHCITFLLIATLTESAINFVYYIFINNNGFSSEGIFNVTKFLLVIRKTLSRVLILIICNGVSITKPSLNTAMKKIIVAFFSLYMVVNITAEFYKNKFFTDDYSDEVLIIYSLIVVMDVVFYVWTYVALYKTISALEDTDSFKKNVYLKLTGISIIGCVAAIAFSAADIYFVGSRQYLVDSNWKYYCLYDVGFWEFLYIYFLITAMKVMTPSIEISKYKQVDNKADIESHIDQGTKELLSGSDQMSSYDEEGIGEEVKEKVANGNEQNEKEQNGKLTSREDSQIAKESDEEIDKKKEESESGELGEEEDKKEENESKSDVDIDKDVKKD